MSILEGPLASGTIVVCPAATSPSLFDFRASNIAYGEAAVAMYSATIDTIEACQG